MLKYFKYLILIIIVCSLSLPWSYNYLSRLSLRHSERNQDLKHTSRLYAKHSNHHDIHDEDIGNSSRLSSIKFVRIGVVSCGLDRLEETMTMIKSALISGMSYHLKAIEVIVFADDDLLFPFDQKLLTLKKELPSNSSLIFRYEIHPLIFPPGHDTQTWLNLFRPCASQRLFLPSALPHINELLYVDTDVLITGDLREIWSVFSKMNATQHTALVPEHEKYAMGWYNRFAKHPYYPPLGVNSGVMAMNLSRMRAFNWERKAIQYHKEYKNHLVFGDQDIINIIFHFFPECLYIIPCNFNYRPDHCIYGQNCLQAETDGIHILHGNRRVYLKPSKVPQFAEIYSIFHEYDLTRSTVIQGLREPLLKTAAESQNTNGNSACKDLSHLITKSFK